MLVQTSQPSSRARDKAPFPGLRPEAQLLLWAASPLDVRARSAQAHSLIAGDTDWKFLFESGAHNEVLPLLYWSVNAACPELVPGNVLAELRRLFRITSIRNLHFAHELLRLIALFNRHGIDAIPYKGPVLAQNVYHHVALRSSVDLDILVRGEDVDRASRLVLEEGYAVAAQTENVNPDAESSSEYHREFNHPTKGVRVEIHWDVLPKSCGDISASGLWERAIPASFGTLPTLTLPAEDMFVLLCIHHGAKHEWDRLKWIADIGWMIETWRTLNWDYVFAYADSLGHEREVLTGCLLAGTLVGVPLPDRVIKRLRAQAAIRARAGLIRGRLFRSGHGLPGFSEWQGYMEASDSLFSTSEGFGPPLVQYLSAIMTPEFRDRQDLALPPSLALFRYALRPLRLFKIHRSALLKRLP